MELRDVQAIWDGTLEVLKPYFSGGTYAPKKDKEGFDEWPEFWPGYRRSVAEREGLLPHIEHGFYPDRLFKLRAPNQTEQEAKYIKENYRQVTLPVYADYDNTILRAANESNFQIDYAPGEEGSNEGQEDFAEYVNSQVPQYGSIFNFWRYIIPRIKTEDAMGVIATLPAELPTVMTETGPVVDPDKPIDPVPVYFPVMDVWAFRQGSWYLLRTNEKSEVMLPSGKMGKEGLVLLLIDDEWIWRIEQVGKKQEKRFEIIQWWAHGVDRCPVDQLKGVPLLDAGQLRWQSHFLPAKEPLDIVLLDHSYLGLSKSTGVFPYRVMLGDDCDFVAADQVTKCRHGNLLYYNEEKEVTKTVQCPKCKGSGLKSRLSPAGVMLINPNENLFAEGSKNLSIPNAIDWVAPPIETLDFLQKQIDANIELARSLMHIDSSKGEMVGGDQPTATKSGIDLRNKYAFIKPISDQYFDLLEFMLDTTGQMRFGDKFQGVEISRPTSFDIRTEQDMLDELATSYATDLPMSVIQHQIWGYLNARYGVSGQSMRAFETIAAADDLFGAPFTQAQYQLSQGLVEKWQMYLHFNAFPLYEQLLAEGKMNGTVEENAELLRQAARDKTPKEGDSPLMSIVGSIGRPAA